MYLYKFNLISMYVIFNNIHYIFQIVDSLQWVLFTLWSDEAFHMRYGFSFGVKSLVHDW